MTERSDPAAGLLAGLRVIDLTRSGAGTQAASLLADYGADVARVIDEDPRVRMAEKLPEWLVQNRGKRLIHAEPHDSSALRALIAQANLVVADSIGDLGKWVEDPDEFTQSRVALITPPYSSEGAPWSGGEESPALLEAVTGIASYQASYAGVPVAAVYPYLRRAHAVWAATCAVAALAALRSSGQGQVVIVDGLQAAVLFGDSAFTRPEDEPDPDRGIGPEGLNPMYTRYQGSDGEWVFVGGLGPKFANTVVDVVGVRSLLDDPRIDGRIERLWHIDNSRWVLSAFQERFRALPAKEWVALLEENDVPSTLLARREDWFLSEQVAAVEQRAVVADPILGEVTFTGAIVDSPERRAHIASAASMIPAADFAWRADPTDSTQKAGSHTSEAGEGPLAGLRAVVFGSYVAGPFVGRLLAALGVEAIKVEPMNGDPWRMQGFGLNRGCQSLAIDLSTSAGKAALKRVLEGADIVVDNFRVGVTERLGLAHEQLRELSAGIVSVSVTSYGERGPLSHKPGYDPVIQAASGMMLAQGGEDEPVAYSLPPNDIVTAVCGSFAAVLGIYNRQATGQGQHLSTALATTATFLQATDLLTYTDRPAGSRGGRDFSGPSALDRFYEVTDGHVRILAVDSDARLRLLKAIAIDASASDENLESEIARALAKLSRSEAVDLLTSARVPAVPARTPREVALEESLFERRLLGHYTSLSGQRFVTTDRLVDFTRTPITVYHVAPGLGEHSVRLLRRFGIDEGSIERLVASGTVVDGRAIDVTYLPPYR